jgi:nicotinamidase-related amidase
MKTLIVVDMQNDFIDGALGTPEARAIVPNVKKKIEEYLERDDQVIFTRDSHYSNYLETLEGKNLPVKHCIRNTDGWQIHDDLVIENKDILVLNKITFGMFDLPEYVCEYTEEIELVGLCTDICVISNAMILKAYFPETPIVVDASCCAGVTPKSHKNALEAMKMCQIEIRGE